MKQNFKKKAFTLVELLVVIAIVAVLASVSIVGYMHFIDKAHTSNDVTLVKQLNTILSASEIQEGQNSTLYEAILDLEESGIKEEDLKSSSKDRYDLLWDQTNDRFAMFDTKTLKFTATDTVLAPSLKNKYKLWKMYNNLTEVEDYSVYLKQDATVEVSLDDLKVGFDVGKNESAFDIVYTGSSTDTKIRTLGDSSVTINNSLADIDIYGNQSILKVLNASNNSVNVFSTVKLINHINGHLNLESNSNVLKLYIKSKNFNDNNFITCSENAKLIEVEVLYKNLINVVQNQLNRNDIEVKFNPIDLEAKREIVFVKNNSLQQLGNLVSYKPLLKTDSYCEQEYEFKMSFEEVHSEDSSQKKYFYTEKMKINVDNENNDFMKINGDLKFSGNSGALMIPDIRPYFDVNNKCIAKSNFFGEECQCMFNFVAEENRNIELLLSDANFIYGLNNNVINFELFMLIDGKSLQVPFVF